MKDLFGIALMFLVVLLAMLPALWIKGWGEALFRPGKVLRFNPRTGAVTLTVFARGGNGMIATPAANTALTAVQASQCFKQSAVVVFGADTDTQALFTHNWGLDASAPTYYEPEIALEVIGPVPGPTGSTWISSLTFDRSNTNVVKVNKLNGNGTANTFLVTLRRPHSTGQ